MLALVGEPAAQGVQAPALAWRSIAAPVRGGEISALAFDVASGSLAIGDGRGVLVGSPDGGFERRLRRGPVRDLAFPGGAVAGTLLAATARGLFLIEPGGAVTEVSPGPGPTARAANRIAIAAGWIAVATDEGVFLSRDARRWQAAAADFPTGAATAVALRERDAALECWAVIGGEPWSARLLTSGEPLVAREVRRQTLSFGGAVGGPVDLVLASSGADVVMVYPAALALRDASKDGWRIVRLELPPGADVLRLGAGAAQLFLATLRGLFVAQTLEGPWRRAEPPAGSAAVRALAGDASVLFAAADSGLLAGAEPAPRAADSDTGERPIALPEAPSIDQVQRAALAYLRLAPGRMDALRRGVARRGWLPLVVLRSGYVRDENRSAQHDEAVSSGAIWYLEDRDRDRGHGYDVAVSFAWELGDIAYHPEEIDVSREAREVLELRDDVLDEVTQLYFERLRVLAQLEGLPDANESEALRLRLRADELAAGIDAWTGGWFGNQTRTLAAESAYSPRIGGR